MHVFSLLPGHAGSVIGATRAGRNDRPGGLRSRSRHNGGLRRRAKRLPNSIGDLGAMCQLSGVLLLELGVDLMNVSQ
jgi:hypothetical protein